MTIYYEPTGQEVTYVGHEQNAWDRGRVAIETENQDGFKYVPIEELRATGGMKEIMSAIGKARRRYMSDEIARLIARITEGMDPSDDRIDRLKAARRVIEGAVYGNEGMIGAREHELLTRGVQSPDDNSGTVFCSCFEYCPARVSVDTERGTKITIAAENEIGEAISIQLDSAGVVELVQLLLNTMKKVRAKDGI